jgi:hypothetical protein
VLPATTVTGAVVAIETSAREETDVDVDEESLPPTGSGVDETTLAESTTGPVPANDDGTCHVVVIVRVAPAGMVASEHGNAPTHAPAFETNVTPAGAGLDTLTARASDGPSLRTVIVETKRSPASTEAGALLWIVTSADVVTAVDDVAVSSCGVGSAAAENAYTVAAIGSGAVYDGGTAYVVVIVRDAPAGIVPSAHG